MTFTLLRGDCLALMQNIPAQSIDLVLCDLPYGTTNCKWDNPLPLDKLWIEYRRICRGPTLLFAQTPFDKILGCSNITELKYEWIWEKPRATGFLHSKRAPLKAHENILVFYKNNPIYNPIKTQGHPRKTAIRRSRSALYNGHEKITSYDSTERYPRTVIKFSSDTQVSSLHPTQKPVALCEYLIRTYTAPGATVLDNCMGSGTTGIACMNSGRDFIGIELDPMMFSLASQRLNLNGSDLA